MPVGDKQEISPAAKLSRRLWVSNDTNRKVHMGMSDSSTACAVNIALMFNPISASKAGYPMGLSKDMASVNRPCSNLAAGSRYPGLSGVR